MTAGVLDLEGYGPTLHFTYRHRHDHRQRRHRRHDHLDREPGRHATFAGNIQGGAVRSIAPTKSGAGNLTLSGTSSINSATMSSGLLTVGSGGNLTIGAGGIPFPFNNTLAIYVR